MKRALFYLSLMLMTVLLMSVDGCEHREADSDRNEREASERIALESQSVVGMPNIHNFQEKMMAKKIMELRDNADLVCHAYISTFTGIHYLGRCMGYGLPYSTQFTNPEKTVDGYGQGEFTTIPQAEANGLFMPTSSSATWITLIAKDGNTVVVYVESPLIVSPVELAIEGKNSSL